MSYIEEKIKNLGVNILPPVKNFAISFMIKDKERNYFCADIYEFRETFCEYIGNIHTYSEKDLKNELKKSFNVDYLMQRNIKNFTEWYEKISNKKLTEKQIKKVSLKFRD